LLPPELPTKNAEGLDEPPSIRGFTTVTFAVPMTAISDAVTAA
jgi:hypothetical protein